MLSFFLFILFAMCGDSCSMDSQSEYSDVHECSIEERIGDSILLDVRNIVRITKRYSGSVANFVFSRPWPEHSFYMKDIFFRAMWRNFRGTLEVVADKAAKDQFNCGEAFFENVFYLSANFGFYAESAKEEIVDFFDVLIKKYNNKENITDLELIIANLIQPCWACDSMESREDIRKICGLIKEK